ncbi:MAG: large subunit ribosomal protein L32 [Alphaproteobacteria bacterium]|jgi:large subunit ribosomal protein L32
MAVPKRKTTPSKRGMRRMHDRVQILTMGDCSNCGEEKQAHTVCPHCGYYKGRQVLTPKVKNEAADDVEHQGEEVS